MVASFKLALLFNGALRRYRKGAAWRETKRRMSIKVSNPREHRLLCQGVHAHNFSIDFGLQAIQLLVSAGWANFDSGSHLERADVRFGSA